MFFHLWNTQCLCLISVHLSTTHIETAITVDDDVFARGNITIGPVIDADTTRRVDVDASAVWFASCIYFSVVLSPFIWYNLWFLLVFCTKS